MTYEAKKWLDANAHRLDTITIFSDDPETRRLGRLHWPLRFSDGSVAVAGYQFCAYRAYSPASHVAQYLVRNPKAYTRLEDIKDGVIHFPYKWDGGLLHFIGTVAFFTGFIVAGIYSSAWWMLLSLAVFAVFLAAESQPQQTSMSEDLDKKGA
jgi:hypothetical protein